MKKAANNPYSTLWSLEDLVDFEYFLLQQSGTNTAETGQQLRHWYQAYRARTGLDDHLDQPDPAVLHAWLEEQRTSLPESLPQPGASWMGFMRLLSALSVFFGFLVGAGVTTGFLRYDGVQPVNVAMFLGFLVVFQMGWNVISFLLLAGKGSALLSINSGLGRQVCGLSFHWVATRLHRHIWSHMPAERRMHWESFWQRLSRDHGSAGMYLAWPILNRIQLLGVAFNVGAVLTFSMCVMFRDLAFGWQTSLQQISETAVASWVKWIALPWSTWLGEGKGYPSLEEIEGSRIILKDGIAALDNPNLTAWWSFLLLSLCCYGLLPRLFLWAWSGWLSGRRIRSYPQTSPSAKKLWNRFQTPYLNVTQHRFGHGDSETNENDPKESLPSSDAHSEDRADSESDATQCMVVVDGDLAHIIERDDFKQLLLPHGWQVFAHASFPDVAVEEIISRLSKEDKVSTVLWIQEAWQPPIMEKMEQMKQCRQALPSSVLMVVGLIGKPKRETWLTPVKDRDFEIWTQFVNTHLPEGTQVKCLNKS